ncbi:hypothetical protein B7988_12055 [Fibrobacter sp. UWB1]|nr:hypothetical protein B7988_12055 [Fibrobacter sp. UWB1]
MGRMEKKKDSLMKKIRMKLTMLRGLLKMVLLWGLTIIVTVLRTGCRLRSLKNRDGRIKKNM